MEIITMPVGDYQTNCYMVWQEGREDCILIDPGYLPERILAFVRQQGKTVSAILLTHGHFDHVGGVRKIAEETGCHVYLREEEKTLPSFMTAGELYSTHGYSDAVTVAGLTFTVLHTPGHTPGSVCLICQDAIFAGDTLFAGSCGRTDFSGSDPAKMKESLQRLYALPGDYRVFPGHGEDTTLQYEREYNPYMRAMSLS
ncbi:MAG: MBL fold metallo-hydrolase [Ruminococcaceae bacterium]|nr:MBL fold metallo-hydrolase [Oscillospiraceae bacterium]